MQLLRHAIAMDPRFGLAKALAAWCVSHATDQSWIAWGSPECIEGIALARSALASLPNDPSALRLAGGAVAGLAHDLDTGQAALDRAIALNGNSAQVLATSGFVRIWLGDFDVARNHFTRAMRLSPLDPELPFIQIGLARALVFGTSAEPARALDLIQKALIAMPNWIAALNARIYCLVRLGRLDEAKGTAQQVLAIRPDFTLSAFRRRMPTRAHVADTLIDLLRQAGIPE